MKNLEKIAAGKENDLNRMSENAMPQKKTSILTWVICSFMLFIMVRCTFNSMERKEQEVVNHAAVTPAEVEAKQRQEARFQRTVGAAMVVKKSMREPDSAKFDSILVNGDASLICMTVRGKNGFGGVSVEHIVFANDKPSKTTSDWNKHCGGKELDDLTYASRAL